MSTSVSGVLQGGGGGITVESAQALYALGPGELLRTPPSSPSDYDDEFAVQGAGVPDGWTLWDERSLLSTPLVDQNGLELKIAEGFSGNVGCSGIFKACPPSGDFTMHCYVSAAMVNSGSSGVGMFVGQDMSTGTNVFNIAALSKASNSMIASLGSGFGFASVTPPGTTQAQLPGAGWLRMRVNRASGNINAAFSIDGVAWNEFGFDGSISTPLVSMGLCVFGPFSGAAGNPVVGRFRGLRVLESLVQPYTPVPSAALEAA